MTTETAKKRYYNQRVLGDFHMRKTGYERLRDHVEMLQEVGDPRAKSIVQYLDHIVREAMLDDIVRLAGTLRCVALVGSNDPSVSLSSRP